MTMLVHGVNENMNTLTTTKTTTIRITSYNEKTDMTNTTDFPVDDSDTESFHSAFTTTTTKKGSANIWNRSITTQSHNTTRAYMIKYDAKKHNHDKATIANAGPRTATKSSSSSDDLKPNPAPETASRPSSRRSSKSSSLTVPRRKSSLGRKKTSAIRKPSSTTLHRQSCQIFSSLDGVLALSRDITPLPSVSSSRTATRHHSLLPEENTAAMAHMCEKLDAKLAYTYSYSYSLNTDSTSSIPLGPLTSEPESLDPSKDSSIKISDKANSSAVTPPRRQSTGTVRRPSQYHQRELPARPPLDTIISWTSDETRQKEYEKIDRANSGMRGMLRKVLPRYMLSKNLRRGFFDGKCDGDSVRRFRVKVKHGETDQDHVKSKWSCLR